MTTLDTLPKSRSSGIQSGIPHSSFQNIYAIETIDLKSVRTIQSQTPAEKKTVIPPVFKKNIPLQLELDLGEEYQDWISPFLKEEPIQVLNLSKHAEKSLIENNKFKLHHLLNSDLKELIQIRGMGQGHIEEIKQRLNEYVEGKDLEKAYKIDFISWLKTILAAENRKLSFTFLEKYSLQSIITLSPSENVEVRKLTLEKKQDLVDDLIKIIASDNKKILARKDMQKIFNVFIKPWIDKRSGFATVEEILERLMRVSLDANSTETIITLIQTLYFSSKSLLSSFLHWVEEGIYCSYLHHADLYELVITKAQTYFYNAKVYYKLDELVLLLEKEFAKEWIGFPEGFIIKLLRTSKHFHVQKAKSGFLEIYKA